MIVNVSLVRINGDGDELSEKFRPSMFIRRRASSRKTLVDCARFEILTRLMFSSNDLEVIHMS